MPLRLQNALVEMPCAVVAVRFATSSGGRWQGERVRLDRLLPSYDRSAEPAVSMPRGGANTSDRLGRSPRFALSTPPSQRRAANDGVKKGAMRMCARLKAARVTVLQSKLRSDDSGANCQFLGAPGLHFETSVSICNAWLCEPEFSRALLSVLLAELKLEPVAGGPR